MINEHECMSTFFNAYICITIGRANSLRKLTISALYQIIFLYYLNDFFLISLLTLTFNMVRLRPTLLAIDWQILPNLFDT